MPAHPFAAPVRAELSAGQLAKMAQNPIGNLISLNTDWNIITRTIIPVISQPAFAPDQDRRATFSSPRSCRRPAPAG